MRSDGMETSQWVQVHNQVVTWCEPSFKRCELLLLVNGEQNEREREGTKSGGEESYGRKNRRREGWIKKGNEYSVNRFEPISFQYLTFIFSLFLWLPSTGSVSDAQDERSFTFYFSSILCFYLTSLVPWFTIFSSSLWGSNLSCTISTNLQFVNLYFPHPSLPLSFVLSFFSYLLYLEEKEEVYPSFTFQLLKRMSEEKREKPFFFTFLGSNSSNNSIELLLLSIPFVRFILLLRIFYFSFFLPLFHSNFSPSSLERKGSFLLS